MKQLYARLPGPAPVKILLVVVLILVALVLLSILFEWAGGILDDGGTIGGMSFARSTDHQERGGLPCPG